MIIEGFICESVVCPWQYFENKQDNDKTKRFIIKDNDNYVMEIDYFINDKNCYVLYVYVYPNYRNRNMPILGSRMMYEYLENTDLKDVENLVYPNIENNVRTIFNFDKRRYGGRFNIFAINTITQEVEEIYISEL